MQEQKSVDQAMANFFANFLGDTSLQEALEDGRSFIYKPQEDITTYELALCVYLLSEILSTNGTLRSQQKVYDLLPPGAQRHFIVVKNDEND
jgi:hypothetical protein